MRLELKYSPFVLGTIKCYSVRSGETTDDPSLYSYIRNLSRIERECAFRSDTLSAPRRIVRRHPSGAGGLSPRCNEILPRVRSRHHADPRLLASTAGQN